MALSEAQQVNQSVEVLLTENQSELEAEQVNQIMKFTSAIGLG